MSKKGGKHKIYTPEFKISVIMDMIENGTGYRAITRKFFGAKNRAEEENHKAQPLSWLKIYKEKGEAGFYEKPKKKKEMKPKKEKEKEIETVEPSTVPIPDNPEAEIKRLKDLVYHLSLENDCLKKNASLSPEKKPNQKEKAMMVSELRHKYRLPDLLKYYGLSKSTYYYCIQEKPDKYEEIKKEITDIFFENFGWYGYRRVTAQLRKNGSKVNHKTVQKLMKALELQGKQKSIKYKSYKGDVGKIAPNILNRNFDADKPYQKLVTDITEFKVLEQKIYLSPILDLHGNEIPAWNISLHPNFKQVESMLEDLLKVLPKDAKPILHSDQGWQYQMKEYRKILADNNITQSMSRKGNCFDNCRMENFFGKLKMEMYYGVKFKSVEEFIDKLNEYIYYYNNKRISLKLNGMSPVEYRLHSQQEH